MRTTPIAQRCKAEKRLGANVIVTVTFWLATMSLVLAPTVSANGSLGADSAQDQPVTTDESSEADPVNGPAPAAHPPEPLPGAETSPPRDPTVQSTDDEPSDPWKWPWPWEEPEPRPESQHGYDKCKRQMPWALPVWCFGSGSWPVLRAHAVTARTTGLRDMGSAHPRTHHPSSKGGRN
jgi:hypothetical protein